VFSQKATISEYTQLTVYSEPNGKGKFKIYKNPSNKLIDVDLSGDFFIKSFSVDPMNSVYSKYEFTHYKFYCSNNKMSDSNSNTGLYFFIIIVIIMFCWIMLNNKN